MAFRALIIDDEAYARGRIKRLLQNYGEILVIGEASDGKTALDLINRTIPDLIFRYSNARVEWI
ncbi:MAG: hypothetical protein HC905_17935 [Bacteroidales bacterium]|nr:hypothetical protein [Bacteroidales bacterium]